MIISKLNKMQRQESPHLIIFSARGECEGALDLFNKQILVSGQYLGVFNVFVEQRQHLFPSVPEL